ncbi:hypothetical protein [Streptomyces sp. NPDC054887]
MDDVDAPSEYVNVAAYLRCHPHDPAEMRVHRLALRTYAAAIRLPAPTIYLDNGCRSTDHKPRLTQLAEAVQHGIYSVVLIPGPWVFSLDPHQARAHMMYLGRQCGLMELPRDRLALRLPASSGVPAI